MARTPAGGDGFPSVLRGAQQGDPDAFDALVGLIEQPLVAFLRARGATDTEGSSNETLVRVFSGIRRFDGNEAQFRAWVFTIARNLLADEHRRRARRPDATATEPRALPDVAADPALDRTEEVERAERLLSRLTDDQREVVVLRVIAGLSVDETAEVVGKRPGAVRALQHRALTQLRQEITRRP